MHRTCALIITCLPEEPSGVIPTRVEKVCVDGATLDDARIRFGRLTNGHCSKTPNRGTVSCHYWEEETLLLRTLNTIANFAQWMGE